jgi:predicted enzyme related to lactoylglutathione lyase
MQPCKIEWLVIPEPDLVRAENFYKTLFNWKTSIYTSEFWLFEAETIHSGFDMNLKPNDQGIRFLITVEDIESKLKELVELGGAILKPKYEIARGFGFAASFKDPNGNKIELWSNK